MRSQSAMEYLMTYGWAILIIAIALMALYAMGLFSPKTLVSTSCVFPADFSCMNSQLLPNGNFSINLEQSTSSPINITAIGCNSDTAIYNMLGFNPNITLQIGSNVSLPQSSSQVLQCFSNGTVFTGSPGDVFHGYVIINYTDIETGFPHTVTGTVIEKMT